MPSSPTALQPTTEEVDTTVAVVLEHDVKEALRRAGVATPSGRVCSHPDQAREVAERLGGRVAVKALVPTGRKVKTGGVRLVDTAEEAHAATTELLHTEIHGFPIASVLVEERVDILKELYVAVAPDGDQRAWRLVFAAGGGTSVEHELVTGRYETLHLPSSGRVPAYQVRKIVKRAGIEGAATPLVARAVSAIAHLAVELDATLLEINPLALRSGAPPVAIGAMCSVDDRALFRHPELESRVVMGVDRIGRPMTDLERAMSELNEEFPGEGEIRFVEFPDGDLGFMVMGGGAGLVSLDELHRLGGRPATFFDMTAGDVEEKIYRATTEVLAIERIRGLLIGVNISAFAPVPIRVRGIARALRESGRDLGDFPVVLRLAGPRDGEAAEIMREFPEVHYFRDDATLEQAVRIFAEEVGVTA